MQDTQPSQIRWCRILNRNPTPPSDFWPALQTDYLIPAPHSGPIAGEVTPAGLSKREAYVMSMHSTTATPQMDHESTSLHSLKRFLDKGIGVDAIRDSVRTSRITSLGSSHRSLAMSRPLRLLDLDEEKAGYDGESGGGDEISLLEMLRASPVSPRSYEGRKASGHAGTVPAKCLELMFNEKHSEYGGSREWRMLDRCCRNGRLLVKTMCAKTMSAIKKRSERLYRVTKWSQPRARRLSKYKRKIGMGPYDGT